MFCKNCGKKLRDDSQFCWNCGDKIEDNDINKEINNDINKDVNKDVKDRENKGVDKEVKNDDDVKDEEVKDNTDVIDIKKSHCINCGTEIFRKADVCLHCGMRLRIVIIKDTGIAAVLSFFIPGLGHIYVGEITIGVVMFFLEILLLGLGTMMIRTLDMKGGYIFLLVGLIFWIYNIFGSYKMAERANNKQYE